MYVQPELRLLIMLFSLLPTDAGLGPLKPLLEWKEIDFEFPNDAARQEALRSGKFVPGNTLPLHLLYLDNRIFLALPRWKNGIPATLATVPSSPPECHHGQRCSPRLRPFPNWDWNNGKKGCKGLTSVTDMNVDKCDRLWVLDSGVVDIITNKPKALCPPQLLSFDLSNNQLIRRYTFPNSVLKCNSWPVTVVLDTVSIAKGCQNTFAYSADASGYGLIVTDTKRGNSWRVDNKLFFPYPNWGTFNIAGETLDIMYGVVSVAVNPDRNPATKRLYFHSLSSVTENYVPVSLLRKASKVNVTNADIITLKGEKPYQAARSSFDSRGILFFGLLSKNSLACWNPLKPHKHSNIIEVAHDDESFLSATGVKVRNAIGQLSSTRRIHSTQSKMLFL